ncbi:MAG: DegT/DnrJ/EryC1/StrS family aminotransferase [Bacteroidales bacterium]|nr:DegT/DnrJ/EryC1/StrS family aminotransferase [Bacteroidales bacterium]
MIKTAFTCNSLTIRHFFQFLGARISLRKASGLRNTLIAGVARYFQVDRQSVFLFGSARMGLYSMLMAGRKDGRDEVIVAGYTCVVVTNAIKYAGLNAVYIDVEEEHLNIDPVLLRQSVNSRTAAIIFTHNFGITCTGIGEFKRDFPDILIIEDAAHTFGSVNSYGIKAGLLGDASFFSMEYSKPITSGMGGIVIVNDDMLRHKLTELYHTLPFYPFFSRLKILISLKAHLFSSSRYNAFLKPWMTGFLYVTGLLFKSSPKELKGERPDHYPVRLSAGLAYIASLQVRDIEMINRRKAVLVKKYYDTFNGIQGIRQYFSQDYNYVRYPLLFNSDIRVETINAIKTEMKAIGIVPGEWFNDVVHPKGSYRHCYVDGSCPVGESVSDRMINLPVTIHKQLTDKDLIKLRTILKKHLSEH